MPRCAVLLDFIDNKGKETKIFMRKLNEMQTEFAETERRNRRELLYEQAEEFQEHFMDSEEHMDYDRWTEYVCYFYSHAFEYDLIEIFKSKGVGILDRPWVV